MKYFCIFDKKSGAFNPHMFAELSIADAVRAVQMSLDEGKSRIAKFPADFQLYLIGDFDPMTGVLTPPAPTGAICVEEVASIQAQYLLSTRPQTPGQVEKGGAH